MEMEKGILFSKAKKTTREYEKSFYFAETPWSAFWDREEQREVTREEALRYDAIMQNVILKQFY